MKKTALYIALGALSLVGLPSCNKFLDVQPKGTLLQEIQFSTLQGYYDAFYGVYGTMASSDLYGQRLTNGFVDELAQMFGSTSATSTSSKTRAYNYTDVSVQAEIYSLWFGQYKVISYVNNILANLESPSISSAHLSQLKGEALGLRAFLHFDLVRLFAEDYQRGKDSRGIPYSYEIKRFRKVNITTAVAILIYIDRMFRADLTSWHIYIFIRMSIAENNAALKLRLAHQNISLRQSI